MPLYLSLAVTVRSKPREGICSVITFANRSDSVASDAFQVTILSDRYIVLNFDLPLYT